MKKSNIALSIGLLIFLSNCANKVVKNTIPTNDTKITIGEKIKFYSKILGQEREIWINVPKSVWYLEQKLPVVYLLDGDLHFYSVVGMIQQLSEANSNSVLPRMITVGILNVNRTLDLTTSHDSISENKAYFKNSGGGEKFISFIERELIPFIDSVYPTAPYRMFVGHSYGGLTVINTLLNHKHLFNSYVAIDPALSWDNQKMLKEFASNEKKLTDKSLFVGMANTFKYGFNSISVMDDTSKKSENKHPRSIIQFSQILKNQETLGLRYKWKYFEQEDHCSVPLIAEYDAFRYIFDFYKPPSGGDLCDTNLVRVDSILVKHFRNVSSKMGYSVLPTEQLVYEYGYGFMGINLLDKSFQCFKLNIENYPNSFINYYGMGEYFLKKGNKAQAIQYFQKSLSLKDNGFIKNKIEQLKTEK